jgi:tRNA-dihydrouridine synthase
VLGNGDIWEAEDALRMMRQTGCDGVVIGRGCLGRPWLFRDLVDVFQGVEPENPPTFGEVIEILLQHARWMVEWFGEGPSMRAFRRHASWYTKGFRGSASLRARLMNISTLSDLEHAFDDSDSSTPFPPVAMRASRGKSAGTQTVALPDGFRDNLEDETPPEAEDDISGG